MCEKCKNINIPEGKAGDSMEFSMKDLCNRQNRVRYNWGFQFALWCAILWGFCYQLLETLLDGRHFFLHPASVQEAFSMGTALAVFFTVLIALISLVWSGMNGGIRELFRAAFASKKVVLCLLTEAVVGGAAAWATYVTAGLLNTLFAVVGVMFYPLLGSFLSRKWLHEKISSRSWVGIGIIMAGWVIFYLGAFQNGGWTRNILTGSILGVLTGIGWGIEGAVASYLTDVLETETGVAVRFSYEAVLWILLLAVLAVVRPESLVFDYAGQILRQPGAFAMVFLIALCLTFNYFSWYRAFTLLGVTKGLVISDASGFITIGAGMLLAVSMPAWLDILASVVMIAGILWIYLFGIQEAGPYREATLLSDPSMADGAVLRTRDPVKLRLLAYIAINGPVWDYEVASWFSEGIPNRKRKFRCRNKIRTYLIEMWAAGLLSSVENSQDQTGRFQKGKLLSKYQLTVEGCRRLQENQGTEKRGED